MMKRHLCFTAFTQHISCFLTISINQFFLGILISQMLVFFIFSCAGFCIDDYSHAFLFYIDFFRFRSQCSLQFFSSFIFLFLKLSLKLSLFILFILFLFLLILLILLIPFFLSIFFLKVLLVFFPLLNQDKKSNDLGEHVHSHF